jgi:glycosyltransferase involved in cell wall biosynthesis
MESKAKRKVLIFIDWFTPAFKAGGPIKSIQAILDSLKGEFDFHIVTSAYDVGSTEVLSGVKTNEWTEKDGYNIIYLSREWENKYHLSDCIQKVNPDVVYFNSLFSVSYTLRPLKLIRKSGVKIVLAPRGMLGEGALKIKSTKKKAFLVWVKIKGLFKGITWHVSSEQEAGEVKQHFGSKSDVFKALNLFNINQDPLPPATKAQNSLKLYFYSRISPKKNLHLALDLLNEVKELPNLSFDIIGPVEDAEYWETCKKRIKSLEGKIEINHIGAIDPNALKKHVADSHLFLFPTKHENFGHVIAESLALGKPSLLSVFTPWHELEMNEGVYAYDLSDKMRFVETIKRFHSMGQDEYSKCSESAVSYLKLFRNSYSSGERYSQLFG